ncbi:MAG: tetratricopeptide repeat protein [Treponema sp.]|nr:tetratricopeptide repeat protein [Treponema sp.]
MKKYLLIFTIIFPFVFFSCATKNEIEAPIEESEITEAPLSEENPKDENDNLDSSNEEKTEEDTSTKEEVTEDKLPLDKITEPEIITLEPKEDTEDISETDKENTNTENPVAIEIVKEDELLPSEIIDTEINFDDHQDYENIEVENPDIPADENIFKIDDSELQNKEGSDQDLLLNQENQKVQNTNTENQESASDSLADSDSTPESIVDTNSLSEADSSVDTDSSEESASTELESSQDIENEQENYIEEEVILASRSVSLNRGETLIVIYPGSGWIYLGSTSEYNNLTNKGRKLGSTDTTYTLLAKEAGTQLHHFYKTDNLTGNYIDDYLEVTVLEKRGKAATKITAPAYSEKIPPRPTARQIQNEASEDKESGSLRNSSESKDSSGSNNSIDLNKTDEENSFENKKVSSIEESAKTEELEDLIEIPEEIPAISPEEENYIYDFNSDDEIEFLDVEESESNQPVENTDELLEQAKALYNEKKYAEADKCLSVFFEYASSRRDEALYLQGQIYESDSPVKDIKKAVSTYKNLIQNYPASLYWDKANKRIIYLNRFYFEAR